MKMSVIAALAAGTLSLAVLPTVAYAQEPPSAPAPSEAAGASKSDTGSKGGMMTPKKHKMKKKHKSM